MEQKLGNDNVRLFNKAFIMICLASLLAHAGNQIVCAILPLYLNSLHFAPSVLGTASSRSIFLKVSVCADRVDLPALFARKERGKGRTSANLL